MQSKPKNICYIVSTLKRTGPINILYNIVKYLDKDKFNPYIITLSSELNNSRRKDFKDLGCKLYNLNMSRLQGVFKANRKILKILHKEDIDLVHTHGLRADIISARNLDEYYRVSTLHNYPYYDYKLKYGEIKGSIMSKIHLYYLKSIECSLACSKSISQMLEKNKNYKMDYLQNGIEIEKFYKINYSKKKLLRGKIGIPLNRKVFIVVGELSQRKDPQTIVNAFQERNVDDEYLIFVGEGELYQKLKNKNNCEYITFKGFVKNIEDYLQASDYYISSSLAEGLPNSVMEALASGLPCILSNIPPHVEILSFNEMAGILFNSSDFKDLNKKVNLILSKDYDVISKNAVKLIRNNLTAEIMSKKYQDKYLELLKGEYV
jgi:glycosyltransferase involved in cell wall biosynthesis